MKNMRADGSMKLCCSEVKFIHGAPKSRRKRPWKHARKPRT